MSHPALPNHSPTVTASCLACFHDWRRIVRMFTFVVGLVAGLAVGVVIARVARGNPTIARLFGDGSNRVGEVAQASREKLSPEIVDTLKRDAADLYREIQEPPAVPVENQPAELPRAAIEEIEQAPTREAALKIASRWIVNEDVAKTITAAILWKPVYHHLTEEKYQQSLLSYLVKDEWYDGSEIEEKPSLYWGEKKNAKDRLARPDFVLGNPRWPAKRKVLVELKADMLASSDSDRALGQMLRYLHAWKKGGPSVLIIGGYVSPAFRYLIQRHIDLWRDQLRLPVTVYFKRDSNGADIEKLASMPIEKSALDD